MSRLFLHAKRFHMQGRSDRRVAHGINQELIDWFSVPCPDLQAEKQLRIPLSMVT